MVLKRPTKEGKSPVIEINLTLDEFLSTIGHVKSGRNLGGPSSKAKYKP